MGSLPLNIDVQQILLHLLNFVLLFAILYFLLYKPVKNFLRKRQEYYEKLDKDANDKLADAEKEKAAYAQKLAGVEDEIKEMKRSAAQEAMQAADETLQEARNEAAHILERARAKTENERSQMLENADKELAEMISEAASKMVFKDTVSAYDTFLDAAERKEANEQ